MVKHLERIAIGDGITFDLTEGEKAPTLMRPSPPCPLHGTRAPLRGIFSPEGESEFGLTLTDPSSFFLFRSTSKTPDRRHCKVPEGKSSSVRPDLAGQAPLRPGGREAGSFPEAPPRTPQPSAPGPAVGCAGRRGAGGKWWEGGEPVNASHGEKTPVRKVGAKGRQGRGVDGKCPRRGSRDRDRRLSRQGPARRRQLLLSLPRATLKFDALLGKPL